MKKILITLLVLIPLLSYSQRDSIIFISEANPSFPGGEDSLKTFIIDNLNYTSEETFKYSCYLQFTVTKEEEIKDIVVLRSASPEFDKECVRVLEIMPKWLPGTVGGEIADVIMTMPITISSE